MTNEDIATLRCIQDVLMTDCEGSDLVAEVQKARDAEDQRDTLLAALKALMNVRRGDLMGEVEARDKARAALASCSARS